jgi:protein TonB
MDRLNILELIQLYTAGCISQPDKIILKALIENDENFPWAELAESQNLIAILPSVLNPELPSSRVKEKIMMKMNKALFVEAGSLSESRVFQKETIQFEEQVDKSESKSKIDWGTLSVLKSSSAELKTHEKIELHNPIIINEPERFHVTTTPSKSEFEKVIAIPEKQSVTKSKVHFSALGGMRKYALIFGVMVVLGVIVFSYFNLIKTSDNNYLQPEIEKPVNVSIEQNDAVINDSVEELVVPENIQLVEEEEKQAKEEIIKKILPTPPPKLPSSIEKPVTMFTENNSVEEKIEEKDLAVSKEQPNVLPKEETKIEEQPDFFVAVEEMPAPIGGLKSIQEKIVYPEIAKRVGIEGKVFIRAYVDESGSVIKAELTKGIGGGCDEAALDAVLNTKFSPGKQRGKPVKVQVTIPIVFRR